MVLWGFRWLKLFLNPFDKDDFGHISESDRRKYMLSRLEDAELAEWSWIVVVAGVGFFCDAYAIFSINFVIVILGIIYYQSNGGTMLHSHETAIGVVTFGGSIIGQIGFGFAADIWGRRKMYGTELIITIGATIGVVMSSTGNNNSMSLIVWLLFWRFALGIGIGTDYPLSAVICSEFAPTRLRGRMLTMVFMCQPLGQLAATLVTLIAVVNQRDGISSDSMRDKCDTTCMKTLDQIWRWIIGVGIIPAVIALWFRLTIIESPRYTADVGRDSRKAASELDRYLIEQAQTAALSTTSVNLQPENQETYPASRRSSGAISVAESMPTAHPPLGRDISQSSIPLEETRVGEPYLHKLPSGAVSEYGSGNPAESEAGIQDFESDDLPPEPSWKDFKQYFWHDGNLRTLLATSFCWFCLDLPFYGLGINSPRIIRAIWYGQKATENPPLYPYLVDTVWQTLVVVSLGSITGCLITLVAINKLGRRNIQVIGFFWLFILFVVVGGSFNHLYNNGGASATIVLYILCQIFFNFGPNVTTYILPAELFPTRYRGLCHGISAASGKLGSVIAQLFLAFVQYPHDINYNQVMQKWFQYSILIFSIFMLLGLITTVLWIPPQEYSADGKVKTLEQWEIGRETPNKFAQAPLAKVFERVWKACAKLADRVYMFVDWLAGGEEKERREQERQGSVMDQEMAESDDRLRGRSDTLGGEGRVSPFVNGNIHHD